jgi:PASTA domain
VVVLVILLGTATFTYAAERRISSTPVPVAKPAAPPVLVVPDVRRQAYVFAKGILEEAGFAWRVDGSVHGYAANTVVEQRPLPGTRVVDTGAPLVVVRLASTARYDRERRPDDVSPYAGTQVRLAAIAAAEPAAPPALVKPKAASRPKLRRPAARKVVPKPKPKAKPAPSRRPPAFVVEGARKEPLDEITLPERARRLDAWLAGRPARTNANVGRWLYQNAWIVTGARFGWWRGAEALRILVGADERAQTLWGFGARSAQVARQALRYVEARSR